MADARQPPAAPGGVQHQRERSTSGGSSFASSLDRSTTPWRSPSREPPGSVRDRLNKIVIAAGHLEHQLFTDPTVVTSLLRALLPRAGIPLGGDRCLLATSSRQRPRALSCLCGKGPASASVVITATGNTVYSSDQIVAALAIASGTPFVSAVAEHALDRIRDLYWRKGYNDMRSEYSLIIDRNAARVDIAFTIVEGQEEHGRRHLGRQAIRRTSEQLILGEVEFVAVAAARSRRPGAFAAESLQHWRILDCRHHARRRQRGTARRFRLRGGPAGCAGRHAETSSIECLGARSPASATAVWPVVRHRRRTGRDPRPVGPQHAEKGQSLWRIKGRYDSEIHEGRVYVSQPSLRSWPRKTTAGVYFRKDLNPANRPDRSVRHQPTGRID